MDKEEYIEYYIKDLEEDVADAKKSLIEAEKEVEDAVMWHSKQLVRYANAIINLNNYKARQP